MNKLKEILRMHDVGISQGQIARGLNISSGVVNKYIKLARSHEVEYSSIKNKSDAEILSILSITNMNSNYVSPDFVNIYEELKQPGVTLDLLHKEYIASSEGKHHSYSNFCRLYRDWSKKSNLSMKQIHKGGEKLFIDYSGKKIAIYDRSTNEILYEAEIFVATLGASDYTYIEASRSQKLSDWIDSQRRAFEFFGGVPKILVPDNLKSATRKSHIYDPDINKTYQQFAEHYNTTVIPSRPYKPKDKSKVENAVLIMQRWILAKIRKEVFYSLDDLNKKIRSLLKDYNMRKFKKLSFSRKDLFEKVDKPNLACLPKYAYEIILFEEKLCGNDYHIQIEGNYYSVPHEYARRKVEVRLHSNLIVIYYKGKLIATHPRQAKDQNAVICNKDHMPDNHRIYSDIDIEDVKRTLNQAGESVAEFFNNKILSLDSSLEIYKFWLKTRNLIKFYSASRVANACDKASQMGISSIKSLESFLENKMDLLEQDNSQNQVRTQEHCNLRKDNNYKLIN